MVKIEWIPGAGENPAEPLRDQVLRSARASIAVKNPFLSN
jgi:hypothetical protein